MCRPSRTNDDCIFSSNKNPTDSKHELVITSGGKEVRPSGDIAAGKTGKVTFAATTQPETFENHCEHHPTTMKGTITISP